MGRFNLDGIPPAPRGIPQIEVTFDIDANGILKVTASDKATSRQPAHHHHGILRFEEAEVEKMRRDAEAHADEDLKRKELIEARNHADNVVYTTEKSLRDFGDKVPAELKTQAEEGIKKVRDIMTSEDPEAIKKEAEELGQVLQKLGASMYQQPEAGQAPNPEGSEAGDAGPATPPDGGEDVVDGEFKNA